jgi:predicted lipoprotein with Yx(FWY)xxD motif
MRPPFRSLSLCALAATSLAFAACGSSGYSSGTTGSTASATQPAATTGAAAKAVVVKTAANPTFGTILVNGEGMTLYALSAERAGKFICTSNSGCLGIWHPLTVSAGAAPSGSVGSLGTVKRPEGTVQVTYNGEPLYTFAQDHQAGEASGEGVKDVGTWSVVKVGTSAAQPKSSGGTSGPAGSSSSEGSGSGEGGYEY